MATLTPETVEQLRAAAAAAAENAYAPYSSFRVGAALLFDDGSITTGCNVENISYGLTTCAERTALFRAIAEHGAARKIVAVMVTNLNEAPSPPCGACRQVLGEFAAPDAVVYFYDGRTIVSKPFAELLPYAFSDWKTGPDARS
jgi:cytidine deaminase